MKIIWMILIILAVLVLLYLLAIKPRSAFGKKALWEPFDRYLYAHRGLFNNEKEAPENSEAAFRRAVKSGYGIELDVQLTKDGIPVVFHDFDLKRACKVEGKLCEYTYEELQEFPLFKSQERIPKLENVLKIIDGKVPLIIEIKMEWTDFAVCAGTLPLLKAYPGVYCIESFNPLALVWLRRYHNSILRGQLSDGFLQEGTYKGLLYFCLQHLLLNFLTKPDFIAYNHKYTGNLSRTLCRGLYRSKAAAWTVKSQADLDRLRGKYDLFIFDSFIPRKTVKPKG